jgi:5-deoxy-glucuronate isomerase
MSVLVKAKRGREIVHVTPQSAGWKYVGFDAYRLQAGETINLDLAGREVCVVVLSGRADVAVRDASWRDLFGRESVFDDVPPVAVYAPDGSGARITARTACEIGVANAPGGGSLAPRLIEPHTMKRSVRGTGANTRYICDILPQSEPAEHLLVVEVRTPAGHSSSYPPHKHDRDALPDESALEETYYHRLNPAQGFAFQRVYTDDRSLDESVAVEDHDVVMVPRGYHPVVVPYGYESYYLNVMAGPTREWHFANDPAHEWMLKPRSDA